eukprot:maker-scaffold198_size266703-snap-gene-0.19 protein:Tk12342 transcript:maker-scaffold198_size266703-snap-gene-0.19-mRNA-1 annotation:"hypothetical protein"
MNNCLRSGQCMLSREKVQGLKKDPNVMASFSCAPMTSLDCERALRPFKDLSRQDVASWFSQSTIIIRFVPSLSTFLCEWRRPYIGSLKNTEQSKKTMFPCQSKVEYALSALFNRSLLPPYVSNPVPPYALPFPPSDVHDLSGRSSVSPPNSASSSNGGEDKKPLYRPYDLHRPIETSAALPTVSSLSSLGNPPLPMGFSGLSADMLFSQAMTMGNLTLAKILWDLKASQPNELHQPLGPFSPRARFSDVGLSSQLNPGADSRPSIKRPAEGAVAGLAKRPKFDPVKPLIEHLVGKEVEIPAEIAHDQLAMEIYRQLTLSEEARWEKKLQTDPPRPINSKNPDNKYEQEELSILEAKAKGVFTDQEFEHWAKRNKNNRSAKQSRQNAHMKNQVISKKNEHLLEDNKIYKIQTCLNISEKIQEDPKQRSYFKKKWPELTFVCDGNVDGSAGLRGLQIEEAVFAGDHE